MTTEGKARIDLRSLILRSLPEQIQRAEARGHPVIIEWPEHAPMPAHIRRLYASLGCLVRFV